MAENAHQKDMLVVTLFKQFTEVHWLKHENLLLLHQLAHLFNSSSLDLCSSFFFSWNNSEIYIVKNHNCGEHRNFKAAFLDYCFVVSHYYRLHISILKKHASKRYQNNGGGRGRGYQWSCSKRRNQNFIPKIPILDDNQCNSVTLSELWKYSF